MPAYPFRRMFQSRIFRNIVRHPGTRADHPVFDSSLFSRLCISRIRTLPHRRGFLACIIRQNRRLSLSFCHPSPVKIRAHRNTEAAPYCCRSWSIHGASGAIHPQYHGSFNHPLRSWDQDGGNPGAHGPGTGTHRHLQAQLLFPGIH